MTVDFLPPIPPTPMSDALQEAGAAAYTAGLPVNACEVNVLDLIAFNVERVRWDDAMYRRGVALGSPRSQPDLPLDGYRVCLPSGIVTVAGNPHLERGQAKLVGEAGEHGFQW